MVSEMNLNITADVIQFFLLSSGAVYTIFASMFFDPFECLGYET